MKLWQKDKQAAALVDKFTVGRDLQFDIDLAPYDVLGSLAHTEMLSQIGLMTPANKELVHQELKRIYQTMQTGDFKMREDVEDIHSQIELMLTEKLGEVGKMIHSGRSRNDQVLVDLKLFMRNELMEITQLTEKSFETLIQLAKAHQDVLMPGYTHMQVAMPSSFGLWFGAYAESLADDIHFVQAAFKILNKNPLGSGAGFGSSFPLNRQLTTELLGFESLNHNVVYAMMGRGKAEKSLAFAMSSIAATVGKLSMDICLYMGQDFAFVSFPDELTTGSSIMPHKKNPDVFELIRGKCNKIQALPNDIALMTTNLPVGYHREMQLIKELLFPAIVDLKDCLEMLSFMLPQMEINKELIAQEKYNYLFTVEEVNRLVLQGVPFRDAYRQVGRVVEEDKFDPDRQISHTHEGSIGNLMLDEIQDSFDHLVQQLNFEKVNQSIRTLIK
jgi:argininosuccinate lyase